MSRAWLPRRFRAGIPVAVALFVAVGASDAFAQAGDPHAVTIIGTDAHSRRCVTGALAGDSSEEVLEECTRALRYPHLSRAGEEQILINRGIVHMRRRESELALADFDTVIARAPRNAEARLNRGGALVQMQQYGPAIAAITEALGLGVAEPHKAYFNRGVAREALGDLRGAYEDYSTALQIQPDWGPANAELARFARTRRDHLATVLNDPTP
jgi:tetratricopeptide (TPR) repeat protein